MLAAFNGHTSVVRLLLEKGARVNDRDQDGRTALMYAASGPFQKTVQLLLEHQAEVDLQDRQEHWTALMFAAAEGHVDVVQTLLDHHADATLRDVDQDTALSFAQQKGHGDVVSLIKKRTQ